MKFLLTAVIACVIILQSSVWAITTHSLNLISTTKEQYSTFLKAIRDDVKDPEEDYGETGIPVIKATLDPRFMRIDLIGSEGTVSLAVQRSNLYVLAYLAKNDQNNFRAYYFEKQITSAELDELFHEAQGEENHQEIEYSEKYPEIEKAAETSRQNAGLGVKKFAVHVAEVSGKAHHKKNEAIFILFAAEMVAEATRFKYIEDMVLDHFEKEIETVDDKVILLETFWGALCAATKTSTHGIFKKTVTMKTKDIKNKWKVKDVRDVKLGLLLHIFNDNIMVASTGYLVNMFDNGRLWIIGLVTMVLVILTLIYYFGLKMAKPNTVKKAN